MEGVGSTEEAMGQNIMSGVLRSMSPSMKEGRPSFIRSKRRNRTKIILSLMMLE